MTRLTPNAFHQQQHQRTIDTNQQTFKLKAYQQDFLNAGARFPCMTAGWATGKSLCGILRGVYLSERFAGNVGVIFRKEYVDLRDSGMIDFEKYTDWKVNRSTKDVILPNKSRILFRHLEELNNLQNINLGWFWIEQGEELDTADQWFYLYGRLRNQAAEFRSGWVTSNAKGHNWIWELWEHAKPSAEYDFYEATTYENADVLPADFITSLDDIKTKRPGVYNRFVLNDRDELEVLDYIITELMIEQAKQVINYEYTPHRTIISCDPARFGDDETVIYIIKEKGIVDKSYLLGKSTMDIAGQLATLWKKYNAGRVVVDVIGIGAGVHDRLCELIESKNVVGINSAEGCDNPDDQKQYINKRAWMWDTTAKMFENNLISLRENDDPELINQLKQVKYSFKNGRMKIEDKADIKKRLGRSPDRGDSFVYGMAYIKDCPYTRKKDYKYIPYQHETTIMERQYLRRLSGVPQHRGY